MERLGRFNYQATTPDYFSVIGTRIVRGRAFTREIGPKRHVSRSSANRWRACSGLARIRSVSAFAWVRHRPVHARDRRRRGRGPDSIADTERLVYYICRYEPAPFPRGDRSSCRWLTPTCEDRDAFGARFNR